MPVRPPTACTYPGCPAPATWAGRCANHPHPSWHNGTPGRTMPRGWAHTRLRILDRDAWACRNCGAPACEVHHMIQGVETDANLIALCHACHQEITQQQARAGHV